MIATSELLADTCNAELLDLTAEEYHARPEWSNSQVKLLPKEPELFHGMHITGEFPKPTGPFLDLGTVFHLVVLEGGPVPVIPRDALNADGHRKGKAWLEYKAEHAGKVLLTEAEAAPIQRMVASIYAEPWAVKLLEAEGQTEQSIFWSDLTGLRLRTRVDKLAGFRHQVIIAELKSTKSPTEHAFEKEIYERRYHRQGAYNWEGVTALHGCEPEAFAIIAVRNAPPYECIVYELDEDALMLGAKQNRRALIDLQWRLETNDWHGPTHGTIQKIGVPDWVYKQEAMV